MSHKSVQVRELAAWGLDNYSYRPRLKRGFGISPAHRSPAPPSEALLPQHTSTIQHLLHPQSLRPDLLEEMAGLQWSLGVADLRALIAFQRRLFIDPTLPSTIVPAAHDWNGLVDMSFRAAIPPQCTSLQDPLTGTITIRSTNPNVHIRTSSDPSAPLRIHSGGPFFEVASFRDRWFLRDGYHRAYALLRAGIYEVPAVIVHARTIQELGAVHPWFFSEAVLFSANPPYIADFLDDALVLTYNRPPLIKTIQITIRESLSPAPSKGEPS